MKDLLEVIKSGRDEFDIEFEKKKSLGEMYAYDFADYLTSHTKAILTNVVERMKETKKEGLVPVAVSQHPEDGQCLICKECGDYDDCDCEGFNHALQTQIDYLEDVLEKL